MRARFAGALLLCGMLLGGAARAQGNQQLINTCNSPTASDDDTITSCTALIQTGQYSGVDLSRWYNNRSWAYSHKGLHDLAIQDQNTAILLDPTDAQAYHNRAVDEGAKRLYDQAIADDTHAIALKPDYAHAYYGRAWTEEKLGRQGDAIADYRAALRFDPSDQSSRAALARLGVAP